MRKLKKARAYLEFVEALAERGDVVLTVSANQFAQGTDKLLICSTVQAHCLTVVLEAGQASQVPVTRRLQQPVAGEWFLVGMRGTQAALAV